MDPRGIKCDLNNCACQTSCACCTICLPKSQRSGATWGQSVGGNNEGSKSEDRTMEERLQAAKDEAQVRLSWHGWLRQYTSVQLNRRPSDGLPAFAIRLCKPG